MKDIQGEKSRKETASSGKTGLNNSFSPVEANL